MGWQNFQDKICSLDLECNENGEIFAVGAMYRDKVFQHRAPFIIQQVLNEFDSFSREAEYLLGHIIILRDLPFCHAINPKLALFDKPVISMITLFRVCSKNVTH
jgi:ATP-dependent DNA helicase RecQ